MPLPIVLLAAGLGSRFGGPKQLAEVGADGEPLFVLTTRRALDAGFDRLVVVTRTELRPDIEAAVARHLRGVACDVVLQDRAPPARDRPWGTAHAVGLCAPLLEGPCGVANSDDLYGRDALGRLAATAKDLGPDEGAVVGYRLEATLSSHGGVNRAVCRVDGAGQVLGILERRDLARDDRGIVDATGDHLPDDTPVSMNLFALGAGVVRLLADRFAPFAEAHPDDDAEMVLPDELDSLIAEGRLRLWHVPGDDEWCGVTHREDLEGLRRRVSEDGSGPRG